MSAVTRRPAIIGGVKVRGVTIVENQDYANMKNKPKINGHVLEGDKTAEELGIHGGGGTSYAFTEGDTDGAFEVTLHDYCFDGELSEEEILTILNAQPEEETGEAQEETQEE